MPLILHEILISHNCTKVRAALKKKGLSYQSVPIPPTDRTLVRRVSGQEWVPVLVDGNECIVDSTRILLHLEERYPDPLLLPSDPGARAECLLLEDWADRALMALTRRIAYWQILARPGALERTWGLTGGGLRAWLVSRIGRRAVRRRFGLSAAQNLSDEKEVREVASIATARLGAGPYLVGDRLSLADICLAAMACPLWAASPEVASDPAVQRLLEWVPTILPEEDVELYRTAADFTAR